VTPEGNMQTALLVRIDEEVRAGHFSEAHELLKGYPEQDGIAACFLYAAIFTGLGEFAQAARFLIRTDRGEGRHPAWHLLAIMAGLDLRENLIAVLRLAAEDPSGSPALLNVLGEALYQAGHPYEARDILQRSCTINPYSSESLNSLGIATYECGDAEAALDCFEYALRGDPGNAKTLSNIACTLSAVGRMDEAIATYQKAIALRPTDAKIRLNHSIALLKDGRWAQGWMEHEWRFDLPEHTKLPRDRLLPTLRQGDDIRGKIILLTQEEGLGDTLMYLRYVPLLIARGAHVHLWVPPELAELCRRIKGVERVQVGGILPDYDWHCPFISLPRVFLSDPGKLGNPVPYLEADSEKITRFRKLLPKSDRLKVGLVWGGARRPCQTAPYMMDRKRSVPLHLLESLGKIENIDLISLQKGDYSKQIDDMPSDFCIHDLSGHLQSMDDTAALLMNIDILVSVDTSVVHLAGALGRPVILMDRFDNCWRWLSGKDTSIWYPQLRIVRQKKLRDWSGVVKKVCKILQKAR
jgi:tetratricopeptide (TPR) repeat protein